MGCIPCWAGSGESLKLQAARSNWRTRLQPRTEGPPLNPAKNAALSQAPLDRDLYSQALKAKGHISLKAVHDEYERLVWQKVRPDGSHDEKNDRSIVENISENEQRQDQSRSRKSAQDDKWSFCLTAGTLLPANQERP